MVIPRIPRQAKCELLGHIDGEEERRESEPSLVTECDSINLPRAVIFRDSFFSELQPFVSEHFRRAVFLWQPNFDGKIVEREPCEIVIQEMAERSLIWWPQSDVFSED